MTRRVTTQQKYLRAEERQETTTHVHDNKINMKMKAMPMTNPQVILALK